MCLSLLCSTVLYLSGAMYDDDDESLTNEKKEWWKVCEFRRKISIELDKKILLIDIIMNWNREIRLKLMEDVILIHTFYSSGDFNSARLVVFVAIITHFNFQSPINREISRKKRTWSMQRRQFLFSFLAFNGDILWWWKNIVPLRTCWHNVGRETIFTSCTLSGSFRVLFV